VSHASAKRSKELVAIELRKVGDADEHCRVSVEVRCREVDAARVGEHQLLHAEVFDSKHQHVVEPLSRRRVDGVWTAAALEAEALAVDEVRRPTVVGDLFRGLGQCERELVEVGHRRHAMSLHQECPRSERALPGDYPDGSLGGLARQRHGNSDSLE